MSDYEIPRPTNGDVLELILDDHRRFEDLLRLARRNDVDREAARTALCELLVAHAEAEEEMVYPTLRRKRAIGAHEEEHGEEEHAEITEAIVGFLEAKGTDTQKYDSALEELATVVNHHSNEEEQTIINPAREDVSAGVRAELGVAWATRRNQLLEEGCASLEQVRALLERAEDEGTIASEEARAEADEIKEKAKEEAKEIEEASKEAEKADG
ncbi:hemerythrin domain-containing protein [Knoellia subterranea]|uniref:Cation-binding protein n=1 Tax=Knoellia subterranea KCTC 19937 TaxID=1385521 RepID=A0A0A0JH13_9MICO|nr:hemerythrin domain-containing protein [Knoellia subterranea]KGN36715.1 cation-binding protein [Knoellia subterranea KCTC 19937]